MLVLALEHATDGHNSQDCQMALDISKYKSQSEHGIQKIFDKRNHYHDKINPV